MRNWLRAAGGAAALALLAVAGTYLLNHGLVGRPVAAALREDPRNSGFELSARFGSYFLTRTLVLDLRSVDEASPADLWRGLFQSAAALDERGRSFDIVVLARQGEEIFRLPGQEFAWFGTQYRAGANPLYLIRNLPSKLRHPNGMPAYGEWAGGWLGVLNQELSDANDAVRTWAGAGVGF